MARNYFSAPVSPREDVWTHTSRKADRQYIQRCSKSSSGTISPLDLSKFNLDDAKSRRHSPRKSSCCSHCPSGHSSKHNSRNSSRYHSPERNSKHSSKNSSRRHSPERNSRRHSPEHYSRNSSRQSSPPSRVRNLSKIQIPKSIVEEDEPFTPSRKSSNQESDTPTRYYYPENKYGIVKHEDPHYHNNPYQHHDPMCNGHQVNLPNNYAVLHAVNRDGDHVGSAVPIRPGMSMNYETSRGDKFFVTY